jgi:hypothetical protein
VGYEYLEPVQLGSKLNPEADIFRRWSPSGNLVAGYLPQKALRNAPGNLIQPEQTLEAGLDRVAWFASAAGRYFEISLSGQLTDIDGAAVPARSEVYGLALLDNRETVLSYVAMDYSGWTVVRLDRAKHQWAAVETGQRPQPPVLIYGAHGNQIVARQGGVTGDFEFFDLRP